MRRKVGRLVACVLVAIMTSNTVGTYIPQGISVVKAAQEEETVAFYIDKQGIIWNVVIQNDSVKNVYLADEITNYSLKELTYPSSVVVNNKTYTVSEIGYADKSREVAKCVEKLTIPSTIKVIGDKTFQNFLSLQEVSIEGGYKIGANAFYNCPSLKKVEIKNEYNSNIEIGEKAFMLSMDLNSVQIQCGTVKIGREAFSTCRALENVYCTGNMTLCKDAFYQTFYNSGIDGVLKVDGAIELDSSEIGDTSAKYDSNDTRDYKVAKYPMLDAVNVFNECKNLRNITIGKEGYESSKASLLWGGAFYKISRIDKLEINTPVVYTGYIANFADIDSVGDVRINGKYLYNSKCNIYGGVASRSLINSNDLIDSVTVNSSEVSLSDGFIDGKATRFKLGKSVETISGYIVGKPGYYTEEDSNKFGISSMSILNPKLPTNESFTANIGFGNTNKLYVAINSVSYNQNKISYEDNIYSVASKLNAPQKEYSNAVIGLEVAVDESKIEVDKSIKETKCCSVKAKYWDGTSDLLDITDSADGGSAICSSYSTRWSAGTANLTFNYANLLAKTTMIVKDTKVDHLEVKTNKTKFYDGESISLNDFKVVAINKDGTTREVQSGKLEVTSSTNDNKKLDYAYTSNGNATLTFKDLDSEKEVNLDVSVGLKQEFVAVYIGSPMISGGVLDMANVRCAYKYSNGVTKDITDAKALSDVADITENDFKDAKLVNGQYMVYRYIEIQDDLGESTTVGVPVVITGSMLDKLLDSIGIKPVTPTPVITQTPNVVTTPSITPAATPSNDSNDTVATKSPSLDGIIRDGKEQDIEILDLDIKKVVDNKVTVGANGYVTVDLPKTLSLDSNNNGKMKYTTILDKNSLAKVDMSNIAYVDYQLVNINDKYNNNNWSRMSSYINMGSKDGAYTLYLRATGIDGNSVIFRTNGYIIDTTKPKVKGVENKVIYKNIESIQISDNFDIKEIVIKKDNKVILERQDSNIKYIDNKIKFTDNYGEIAINGEFTNGLYDVSISDYAGNKNTVQFNIDTLEPSLKGIKNKGIYKKVKLLAEDISGIEYIKVNGKPYKNKQVIAKDGKYTVETSDKLGNTKKVSFTIDSKSPTIKGVKNNKVYRSTVKIKVYDKNGIKSVSLNGKKLKVSKTYTFKKKGKYKLKVMDKAGNSKQVSFSIKKK